MHKIGLKLWSVNFDQYHHEIERLYPQGYFDYIELFVLPDSLTQLNKWRTLKIPFIIHNAHSFFNFNPAEAACAAQNKRIYNESKKYADTLQAEYIIFHGGVDGNIHETAKQLKMFNDARCVIENKPFKTLPNPWGYRQCRGFSLSELQIVIAETKCKLCLDFGHAICAANSLGVEPYRYIQNLMTLHPAMYHLSDIIDMKSEYDSHPNLGNGQLDIKTLLSQLPDRSVITIETDKKSKKDLNDFVADSLFFRLCDSNLIHLRPMSMNDMHQVFELSNDALVRQNSFSTEKITWDSHVSWFERKLRDDNCVFLAAEQHGRFAAQIRFDRENDKFVASFSVAESFRHKGLSASILRLAVLHCRKHSQLPIAARIKANNIASIKCFSKVGFKILNRDDQNVELIYE